MTQTLAIFGATGGCAGSCLAAALKQGYSCKALARTPSKLTAFMLEKGVEDKTLDSYLTIIPGDIRDIQAVKQTLANADIIISGIGAYPKWQWSLRKPLALTDPTLSGVQSPNKPRALPLIYLTFYYWLLAEPHADKVALEAKIHEHMQLDESQRWIGGYVLVRPSILADGNTKGVTDLRAGLAEDPPVGYSVDRKVVGEWIFEVLIRDGGAEGTWRDGEVIVTF
ncbi:hypothetical protein PRZ48_003159 [Zasmidium cellare]|uniref:NAD(P)-binding domain-containing protein n=1 Tax=Zasmidium cellare TaxID=395010 RepID=A0ABR0EVI8_ZASCE|nr:hypothetical protein PRZ48_003159 [Zasmidium cellare]